MITSTDLIHLNKALKLARKALLNGDQPFGSVLVDKDGVVRFEDHNRIKDGDHTRHPEFEIAKWAMNNMTLEERPKATVYTSGEHCPMCAAAHGWANLGRIIYAASSKQLTTWLTEFGAPPARVKPIPIQEVISDVEVIGPVDEFSEILKSYHKQNFENKK